MRLPSAYELYLNNMADYYRSRKENLPKWLQNAFWCQYLYLHYFRFSLRGSAIQTIEKLWKQFESVPVDYSDPSSLPYELSDFYKQSYYVLFELNRLFVVEKNPLYVNGKEITKQGGKKMNELSDLLPKFQISMPENKFTNMPPKIIFGDSYISSSRTKSEHSIEIDVFRNIVINDKKLAHPLNFKVFSMNAGLMDELIRILQWEQIMPFLYEADAKYSDNSLYSDFRVVHVSAGRYHADINLLEETDNNPFVEILRMIWDVYKNRMKEENIVPPWFEVQQLIF